MSFQTIKKQAVRALGSGALLLAALACSTHPGGQLAAASETEEVRSLRANDLTYEEAQFGFAGRTGTRWEVRPDGTVLRFRILPDDDIRPDPTAAPKQLSPHQLDQLDAALREIGFADLEIDQEQEIPVNPAEISISASGKTLAIQLEPGQTVSEALTAFSGTESTEELRFLQAAQTIRSLLISGATEPEDSEREP